MSMTSSQCDELRKAAQTYRGLGNHRAEQLLLDAADTISELRDRLTSDLPRLPHFWTHDGTLHIEAPKLPEGIAVTLPDERDREVRSARVWRYVREDESENARLREENERLRLFAKGYTIITDYWKDDDGTMHVLTTDGSSTYEYMRGGLAEENARLRDENAKLRELLRDVNKAAHVLCEAWEGSCSKEADGMSTYAVCPIGDTSNLCVFGELYERMREVGIGDADE